MDLSAPLRLDLRLQSGGAASELVLSEPVPRGEIWRITHIAWEDETSAVTSGRTLVSRSGGLHMLEESTTVGAGVLITDDNSYLLGESERVGVRFVGATSGDILRVFVDGERLSLSRDA